mmetsp:Transcript_62599/g.168849  ORF Transcript_62599/g.168849 Transcript_62599/m.168849 type:complete len:204 (+) Transcript_62599:1-612(+)
MGWSLGVIEAIIYVMVIGLSVDYVVHLADAYLECPEPSNKERARFMVTRMGISVLSGALTSLGLGGVMILCYSLFLVKFGAVIFFVVCKAVVAALVFFTAMLATVGPSGNCGSLDAIFSRKNLPEKMQDPAREVRVAVEAEKGPPGYREYRKSMVAMHAGALGGLPAGAFQGPPGRGPQPGTMSFGQPPVEVELAPMGHTSHR